MLYEGVSGGEMDSTNFWYAYADHISHSINEPFAGDLPASKWMAFGDQNSSLMIYMLHHEDDEFPDNHVSRPDMTMMGFGRQNKDKYLNTVQTFSIGFIESTDYSMIDQAIRTVLDSDHYIFLDILKLNINATYKKTFYKEYGDSIQRNSISRYV